MGWAVRLVLKLVLHFEVNMTKSSGIWKTDVKTATLVKAIAAALLTGGVAGGLIGQDVADGVVSILSILFG